MLLLIDAGNTNCVFAVHDGHKFVAVWRCKTDALRSADEYAVLLQQWFDMKKITFADIENVILSSVVPDANFQILRLCQEYFNCEALLVGRDTANLPLKILLDKPEEIGGDRVVNAMAVRAEYPTPAIVIDFGTATTFDVITKEGAYAGGIIAPGINLSLSALHKAAAKLPKIEIAPPAKVIGTNTVEAMRSGIYWGYVGLIEGLIKRLAKEIDGKAHIIATGGLAEIYAKDLPQIDKIDRQLTLKGLLATYNSLLANTEKAA